MTPHEVLGLAPDATEDEAEEAYYRLLRVHHPDLHQAGSPEEIAAAEMRTRALNLAMRNLRDSFDAQERRRRENGASERADGDRAHGESPGAARAARGAHTATAGSASTPNGNQNWDQNRDQNWDQNWDQNRDQNREHSREHDGEQAWDYTEPMRVAGCPFCGTAFTNGALLRDHVLRSHHVRLDHRRRSRIGRHFDRFGARFQHTSLWYLVPLNAVFALTLAVAVTPLATDFAMWVFGVAMAPTFILLMDRGSGSR